MAKNNCGPEARAWLKTALDPFHDYDVAIAGIPDADSQPSVVQIIPVVTTLTAPPNLAVGETWSVQGVFLPTTDTVHGSSFFASNDEEGIRRAYDGSQPTTVGTCTFIRHGDNAGATKADTAWSTSVTAAEEEAFGNTIRSSSAISASAGGTDGVKKIIAGGVEVHNDTADLYKQGSVTVFQSSQVDADSGVAFMATGTAGPALAAGFVSPRLPPASKAEASSLPTSRTWEAAKGCYVPLRLGTRTRYRAASRRQFHMARNNSTTDNANSGFAALASAPGVYFTSLYSGKHRPADIETTGFYFSGLSQETVLTVTVKLIVELAPTPAQPDLLFMATPTPDYCPKALEMYYQAIRHLPPGVPVSFNAKGDWYKMVLKALNVAAPLVLPGISAINPPVAAALSSGLATANAIGAIKKPQRDAKSKNVSRPNR